MRAFRDSGQLPTGAPLGKVELLAEENTGGIPPFSTFSDAKGNFAMVNLPAGQYRLKGHRNGHLDTLLRRRRPGRGGTVIVLEAGQELKDLQVKLAPFGVISRNRARYRWRADVRRGSGAVPAVLQ